MPRETKMQISATKVFWTSRDTANTALVKSYALYRQEWLENLDTHGSLSLIKKPCYYQQCHQTFAVGILPKTEM